MSPDPSPHSVGGGWLRQTTPRYAAVVILVVKETSTSNLIRILKFNVDFLLANISLLIRTYPQGIIDIVLLPAADMIGQKEPHHAGSTPPQC